MKALLRRVVRKIRLADEYYPGLPANPWDAVSLLRREVKEYEDEVFRQEISVDAALSELVDVIVVAVRSYLMIQKWADGKQIVPRRKKT